MKHMMNVPMNCNDCDKNVKTNWLIKQNSNCVQCHLIFSKKAAVKNHIESVQMLTWLSVKIWVNRRQLEAKTAVVNCGLATTSVIFGKSSEEGAVGRAGSFLNTNNMLHCIWKLDKFLPDLFLARPFSHFGHKAWQIGTRGKSPPQQEGDGDLSCWTCIRTDMVCVINLGDKFLNFLLTG